MTLAVVYGGPNYSVLKTQKNEAVCGVREVGDVKKSACGRDIFGMSLTQSRFGQAQLVRTARVVLACIRSRRLDCRVEDAYGRGSVIQRLKLKFTKEKASSSRYRARIVPTHVRGIAAMLCTSTNFLAFWYRYLDPKSLPRFAAQSTCREQ